MTNMSAFPTVRMRRLRRTEAVRDLVRETTLRAEQFIAPIFVTEEATRAEIPSLPGVERIPLHDIGREAAMLAELGIRAVLLFGIPDVKDAEGSASYDPNGV